MRMTFVLSLVVLSMAGCGYAWAQDDASLKACDVQASAVKVDSPLKVVEARKAVFDACLAAAITDPQRKTLALFNSAQVMCNDDVKKRLTNDPLITTAGQAEIFSECMADRNYVVIQ